MTAFMTWLPGDMTSLLVVIIIIVCFKQFHAWEEKAGRRKWGEMGKSRTSIQN